MKRHARIRPSDNRELCYPLVRGLDHGRSSQSWGPTVEVHHGRRPGPDHRAMPGCNPRARRLARRDRGIDPVPMARAGPPGRSSVLSPGRRRSGRRLGGENSDFTRGITATLAHSWLRQRARGSENPFTCKMVGKTMRTSRNRGLLPLIVSRIAFPASSGKNSETPSRNPGILGSSISGYSSGEKLAD